MKDLLISIRKSLSNTFLEIRRYPSAVAGIVIIGALIGVSIYTMVTIPYAQAQRLWRGSEAIWYQYPKLARPEWVNLFRSTNYPSTILLNTRDGTAEKTYEELAGDNTDIHMVFAFDYVYDEFPQEITIYFRSTYQEKFPFVSMTWHTPDGREIRVGDQSIRYTDSYRISQDTRLQRRVGGLIPHVGLLAVPDSSPPVALQGRYELRIDGLVFEPNSDIDAELVMHGQVHGWAGTDHRRRDLSVALLWGTPIALAFGLLAALGTTVLTMIIAAVGVWFGGILDSLIQRITQVNLVLPVLPILIMVGTFYDRSIWTMLGVVIVLSIFSASILTYRAIFLQVRESPYIEAARAYGSGHWRIVLLYMVPRIVPLLVPQLVVLIPSYVFLEASLAVLGLGDPVLPTWGKLINDALNQGALFQGYYYWVLEPAFLLILTGFAFAMVGFALDRIFNPRLRGL
jgi:peptide/nickel transport system permease protein